MNNLKMSASIFIATILLMLSFSIYAAGIDDIVNQVPVAPKQETGAEYNQRVAKERIQKEQENYSNRYSIQNIIDLLPQYLFQGKNNNPNGIKLFDEDKTAGFNKENFGRCQAFYFFYASATGGQGTAVLDSTLNYLVQVDKQDERMKALEGSNIKAGIEGLQDISTQRPECRKNKDQYVARLKELLNTVIQAGPAILAEQKRMAMGAQQTKSKELAKEQASLLAEQERINKAQACMNTNEYKLYAVSANIVQDVSAVNYAQQAIDRQNEGAKISGYVDKDVMYKMGNTVATGNRDIKNFFEFYKKIGGSAANPESVKRVPNPCK